MPARTTTRTRPVTNSHFRTPRTRRPRVGFPGLLDVWLVPLPLTGPLLLRAPPSAVGDGWVRPRSASKGTGSGSCVLLERPDRSGVAWLIYRFDRLPRCSDAVRRRR